MKKITALAIVCALILSFRSDTPPIQRHFIIGYYWNSSVGNSETGCFAYSTYGIYPNRLQVIRDMCDTFKYKPNEVAILSVTQCTEKESTEFFKEVK